MVLNYTPTVWVDDSAPDITADNLNNIENQLVALTAAMNAISPFPVGAVLYAPTSAVPTGFLECNGDTISRETYSDLFDVISTNFGAGDGSTTFSLPDLRGVFVRCWAHDKTNQGGDVYDEGRGIGDIQIQAMAPHAHYIAASMMTAMKNIIAGGAYQVADASPENTGNLDFSLANFPIDGTVANVTYDEVEFRPINISLMPIIKY